MLRKIGRPMTHFQERAHLTGNSFLDSLPEPIRMRIAPQLTKRTLNKGQVLGEPGVPFETVYFPVRSVISTLTRMHDGTAVEVGFAGHDGFSPVVAAFGSFATPHTVIVQIPDSAYAIDARALVSDMKSDSGLAARMRSYAEYSYLAATQFTACNRLHTIAQRYARWILMADDRVGGSEFVLTHDFTAQMLGVRRAGVTDVASRMSQLGLISYRRSHVKVLNRHGLEREACECYVAINAELRRLLTYEPRRPMAISQAEESGGSYNERIAMEK